MTNIGIEGGKAILDKGFDGATWVLVDKKTKEIARPGIVTTWRGYEYRLVGGRAPQHENSTGRVYCKDLDADLGSHTHEWFPSVVNLKWVPVVSEAEA